MKPKLPRALLWRDKKSMDEMMKEPFCQQLLQMFMIACRSQKVRFSSFFYLPIMNEVYYQCTRVVYENDPYANVRNYISDINANLGGMKSTTRMVLSLMTYLLMAQSSRSDAVVEFMKKLNRFLLQPDLYYADMYADSSYLSSLLNANKDEGFFLIPEPCSADDLEGMVIDWQTVTRDFTKPMINEVLMLWRDSREQAKVLKNIEKAFNRRQMTMFEKELDLADTLFFIEHQNRLNNNEDDDSSSIICSEPEPEYEENSETYDELMTKVTNLEKRNAALETENQRLKSELNNRKQKSKQARAFTLSMIVDYCKNRVDFHQVEGIVGMLYKFLRSNGTDEEFKLVDDIEISYIKKSGVMHIYHADVAVGIAEKDANVYHH